MQEASVLTTMTGLWAQYRERLLPEPSFSEFVTRLTKYCDAQGILESRTNLLSHAAAGRALEEIKIKSHHGNRQTNAADHGKQP
jgi:hypothetical protein